MSDRREFARIYEEGAKMVGRLLVLYVFPASDHAKAVVASRKVGSAVRRNRAKRVLRAALMQSRLRDRAGADTVRDQLFPVRQEAGPDRQASPAGPAHDPAAAAPAPGARPEAATASPASGVWVVAVARARILAAKSQDVTAEIEALLDAAAAARTRGASGAGDRAS
ncbi:MAG: ribonuclease P protein component [Candidatus Krumholzibacteriia bacterium]